MPIQDPQLARVISTGRYIIDRFERWPEQPFRATIIKAGRADPQRLAGHSIPLRRTLKERGSLVLQVADLISTYRCLQLTDERGSDALSVTLQAVLEVQSRADVDSVVCSIPEHDLIQLSDVDTLQECCRRLFGSSGGGAFWFHPDQTYAALAEVRSLLILDGVGGSAADIIACSLSNATLLAIGSAGQQFRPISIPQLTLEETISFVKDLVREHVSPYEPPTAAQITEIGRLLEFAPTPIELLLRLQRHRVGSDWDTLIARLGESASTDPLDRVAEVCLRQLNTQQRQLLIILCSGQCSGAALQAIHMDLYDGGSNHRLREDLLCLCELGLVQISNDDWAIASAALRRSFSRVAPPNESVYAAIDRYVYSMLDQSTGNQVLAWAQRHFSQIMGVYARNRNGDTRNTKRCLGVLVPLVVGYGWWDKWEQLANEALELARRANDHALEVWAQYELGLHAGLSGRKEEARTLLKRARKTAQSLKSPPVLRLIDQAMHVLKIRRRYVRSLLVVSARLVATAVAALLLVAAFLLFPPSRSIRANTERNVSVKISELAQRSLPQPGSLWQIARIDNPAHGYLTQTGDGNYIYTPARDYAGSDGFGFVYTNRLGYTWAGNTSITVSGDPTFASTRISDVAQVIVRRMAVGESIEVRGRDIAIEPTSGALRFSDVSVSGIGGSVSTSHSGLRFTPPPSVAGTAVINLIVSADKVAPARRLLVIDVGASSASQLPNAHNDPDPTRPRYRVDLATPAQVALNVLDNDTDLQGRPLIVQLPAARSLLGAQLKVSADGRQVLYEIANRPRGVTPHEDVDAFIYQACTPNGACAWALVSMIVGVPAYALPPDIADVQPSAMAPSPTAAIVAPITFFPSLDSANAQFMLIGAGFEHSEPTSITLIDPAGHVFDTTAVANEAGLASVQLAAKSGTPGIWIAAVRGQTSGNLTLTTFQLADLAAAAAPIEQATPPAPIEMSGK